MLSDVTNEKIKYANCGENRELLIDEIIRIGILDVSGNPLRKRRSGAFLKNNSGTPHFSL